MTAPAVDDPQPEGCSFCQRPRAQVLRLVAGPGVAICDECVGLCTAILRDDSTKATPLAVVVRRSRLGERLGAVAVPLGLIAIGVAAIAYLAR